MKKLTFLIFIAVVLFFYPGVLFAKDSFWDITSIDTMKFSRDISSELNIKDKIPRYVKLVASMHPSHIAIATPYDEEFYPILSTWVIEARKNGLKVWFRGNFSSWETWFGYPPFKDPVEHHAKTMQFILTHPELFTDGDIFTPVPEPENGGYGDPRGSLEKTVLFRQFLIDSYKACDQSMQKIGKKVYCGFFSVNGDVAKDILDKQTVDASGGVVVMDHFVKDPEKLVADISAISDKYQVPVIVGEFGAPIPDIHGEMSESVQARYVSEVLSGLVSLGKKVKGVNYWTAFGGSTKIYEQNETQRQVGATLSLYYQPTKLKGVVMDQYGNRLKSVAVSTYNGASTVITDSQGHFETLIAGVKIPFVLDGGSRFYQIKAEVSSNGHDVQIQNFTMVRKVGPIENLWFTVMGIFNQFGFLFKK